ncbi:hypothetical protein QTN25_007225 [Entamoeba marina]
MSLNCFIETADLWIDHIFSQIDEMSLVPHVDFDHFQQKLPLLVVIEKSFYYPSILLKLQQHYSSLHVFMYDSKNIHIQTIDTVNSKLSFEDLLQPVSTLDKGVSNLELQVIIKELLDNSIQNYHIIHYSPSLNDVGTNFISLLNSITSLNIHYTLLLSSIKNTNIIHQLAEIRKAHLLPQNIQMNHPFSTLVYFRETPFDLYPFTTEIHGIFVKLPENYSTSPDAWKFHTRSPFYVVTPTTLYLKNSFTVGKRRIATLCHSQEFHNGSPLVIKEHRLISSKMLLSCLDDMETQQITKEICEMSNDFNYNILSNRVFIETNQVFNETTRLSLEQLLSLDKKRIGTVERHLPNLTRDVSKQFEAFQHWSYFLTARQLVVKKMKISPDFGGRCKGEGKLDGQSVTSVVVCHESLTKYYFTNTNTATVELMNFEKCHQCNESCIKYPKVIIRTFD